MSIYKPSLLDKFKDFVNGLKSNWDAYEDHVADFESHLAEKASDDVHGLSHKGLLLRLDASFSVPSGSEYTKVPWDSVIYDDLGFFSLANPTEIVIPAGVKKIRTILQLTISSDTPNVVCNIKKNNKYTNGISAIRKTTQPGDIEVVNSISSVIPVLEGDILVIEIRHASTTSKNIVSASTTWFAVEVVE